MFCWHKYTEWFDPVKRDNSIIFRYQKKECIKCGKVKTRLTY